MSVTKSNTSTWALSGADTYTGATTVSGGALNIQNAGALGTATGQTSGVTVSSGAALQIQGGISTTEAVGLTLNGTGVTASPNGALENVSGSNTYSGLITLGSASTIGSDAGTLTLSNTGVIFGTSTGFGLTLTGAGNGSIAGIINGGISGTTGAGTLTKNGAGTWTLSGANTYTGATTVNAGTLNVTGSLASGSAVAVNGGGTLTSTGTGTVGGAVTVAGGTSSSTYGTISVGQGSLTLSGGLTLGGSTNIPNSNISQLNLAPVSGNTSAAEIAVTGALTTNNLGATITINPLGIVGGNTYELVSFSGSGTYDGSAFTTGSGLSSIDGFTLSTSNPSFGISDSLTVTNASNGILELVTTGQTYANLWWYGNLGTAWNANNGSTGNFSTVASGDTGAQALPSSVTTVNFSATGANDTGPITLGQAFTIVGLNFLAADTNSINITDSSNSLTIGTIAGISDANNTGVTLSVQNLIPSVSQTWTNSSGALFTIGNVAGPGTVGTTTLTLTNSGSGGTTISGVIGNGTPSGTLALIVKNTGSGVTTLSNTNTYSGGTTLNDGTLTSAATGGFGTGSVTVNPTGMTSLAADNATLNTTGSIASSAAVTVNSEVSDGGFGIGTINFNGTAPAIGSLSGNGHVVLNNASGTTLTVSGGGTFSGAISQGNGGTGSLTVTGGTLTLSGANTYTGTTSVTAGTLSLTGGSLTSSVATSGTGIFSENGAGVIAGSGATFTQGSTGQTSTLAGANTYGGTTTVSAGTLVLSGSNSSSGATTVSGGTLQLANTANDGGLASGTLSLNGGTLQAAVVVPTITNAVSLTGSSTISAAQALTLAGVFTNSGANTLTVNNSGATAITGGNVYLSAASGTGGALTINGSGAVTIGDVIANYNGSGTAGSLTYNGTSTLTLSGANTYTGATTVSAGTLILSGTNVSALSIGGSGTLQLQANVGNTTSGVSSVMATQNMTLAQLGSGGGGATIQLRADNTIASGGVVAFDSGATEFGVNTNNNRLSGVFNFDVNQLTTGQAATTLQLGSTAAATASTGWQIGSGSTGSSATFNVTGGDGYTLQLGGFYVGNNYSLIFNPTTANLIVGGLTNGSTGSVTKNGQGTLTINGASNYSGTTTVNAGTLVLSGSNSSSGATTVSGGTLQLANTANDGGLASGTLGLNGGTLQAAVVVPTITNAVSLTGSSTISAAQALTLAGVFTNSGANTLTVNNSGATAITGGNVYLSAASGTGGALTINGSGAVTIGDVIADYNGSGTAGSLTYSGTSTLTLSGANTYSGTTTVSAGTLQAGVASVAGVSGAFGLNSAVSIANVSGATLALNGYDNQIGSLTGGGGTVSLGSNTLTIAGAASPAAFAGNITGASGNLVVNGGGVLTLSGANSFTGTTTLSGTSTVAYQGSGAIGNTSLIQVANNSTVQLAGASGGSSGQTLKIVGPGANGGALEATSGANSLADTITLTGAAASIQSDSGATVTLSGNIGNSTASTLTLTGLSTGANTISGNINNGTGVTSLAKTAGGTWLLAGTDAFTGGTTISGGKLQLNNANALENSTVTISTASGLTFSNAVSGGSTYNLGALKGSSNEKLSDISNNAVTLDVGSNGTSTTYSGALSGAGGITKVGTGTMFLTTANTFTGGATVNNGVLEADATDAFGTATATANSGGTLAFLAGITYNRALSLNGAGYNSLGALTINGDGGSPSSPSNDGSAVGSMTTFNGQITVASNATLNSNGGTVVLAGGLVKNGTVATLTGGGTFDVNSAISGSSSHSDLDVTGATTVALNAADSYNGPTMVYGGSTLQTFAAGALPIPSAGEGSVVTLGNAADSGVINTLDLEGTNQTIAALKSTNDANETNTVTNSGSSTSTLTVTGIDGNGNTINGTFGGVIANGNSPTALAVSGGTQTLSGVNTYSGGTTVSAGKLVVDGGVSGTSSGTGSGAVNVTSTGKLAGSGNITTSSGISLVSGTSLISGDAQTGPTVSGTGLTITDTNVSVASANLTFSLGAGTSGYSGGTASSNWDFSNPNNNSTYLTLAGSSTLNFTGSDSVTIQDLTGGALHLNLASPYLLVEASSNGAYTGLVTDSSLLPGGTLSLNGNGYVVGVGTSTTNYTPLVINQTDANGNPLTGNNAYPSLVLYLDNGQLDVVPEPGTWALMIGGLALLIVIQRRRNKVN